MPSPNKDSAGAIGSTTHRVTILSKKKPTWEMNGVTRSSASCKGISKSTETNILKMSDKAGFLKQHARKQQGLQSQQQKRQSQKQQRRSAILSSLDMLDVDENDKDDYKPKSKSKLQIPEPRGTSLRREVATNNELEAEVTKMQPTAHQLLQGSDCGNDHDSGIMKQEDKQPRRRYSRRGSVTEYSLDAALWKIEPSNDCKLRERTPLPTPPSNSCSSEPRLNMQAAASTTATSSSFPPRRASKGTSTASHPLPEDDLYSENLNDSGYISFPLPGDDTYSGDSNDSRHGHKTPPPAKPAAKPKNWKKTTKSSSKRTTKTTIDDLHEESSSRSEEDVLEPTKRKPRIHQRVPSITKALRKKKPPATTRTSSSTCSSPVKNGCLKYDDAKPSTHLKKVRFGNLVIREFPVILGDNPAVTSGAPVTIDWTPQNESSLSIKDYEQYRPRRRRRRKLLISVSNRAILLLAAGYSIDEIADASMNAQQIKFWRQESMQNQNWDRVNMLMENTSGALRGMVTTPGKKLKSMIVKPMQHSETARTA